MRTVFRERFGPSSDHDERSRGTGCLRDSEGMDLSLTSSRKRGLEEPDDDDVTSVPNKRSATPAPAQSN